MIEKPKTNWWVILAIVAVFVAAPAVLRGVAQADRQERLASAKATLDVCLRYTDNEIERHACHADYEIETEGLR